MWPGPYGEWGSRKYLLASLDQSLKRMGLDYVDIFYSHRFDPATPLEETMGALDTAVRQGKALYVGVSSYNAKRTGEAAAILRRLGTPFVIHQPSYSMLNRWIEEDHLLDQLEIEGVGCICFSPLAQGLLSDKYLGGVPADSRAASGSGAWRPGFLSEDNLATIRALNDIARKRGQSLAEMAVAWVLRDPARHLGADRREPARADRRRGQGRRQDRVQRRRTRRNRRHGQGGRRQHLAAVERVLNERGCLLKTTRYFEEQVLRKRPYIDRNWCVAVLAAPVRSEKQLDGRIRYWGTVVVPGETKPRYLRVVTLEDGETIHNAFFDRRFQEDNS